MQTSQVGSRQTSNKTAQYGVSGTPGFKKAALGPSADARMSSTAGTKPASKAAASGGGGSAKFC